MSQLLIGAGIGAAVVLVFFLVAGWSAARRKARTTSSVSHVQESVVAVIQSKGGRKRVIN